MIDEHLENIDRRLTKLEQFLPTLATKEELRTAIVALATTEELRAAIEPLATKEERGQAVHEEGATKNDFRELRRHMDILAERLRGDIHALIDAIELMKYIDSEARQQGTGPAD